MKTIVATILACFWITAGAVVSAQGVEIDCGDNIIIQDGIDVQFLTVSPEDNHYITVFGIEEFDPVLAVFNQQQFGSCSDDAVEASGMSGEFPSTGIIFENDLNSQLQFTGSTFMRTVMSDFDNADGEAVLMVEGLTMDGQPDRIDVVVTERMIESQIPLTFYALPVEEDLDLKLALVDDNGVSLLDDNEEPVECDDAGDTDFCWGVNFSLLGAYANISGALIAEGTEISPMLTVPLTSDDLDSIVPVQVTQSPFDQVGVTGEYVFVMHYGVGDLGGLADGQAEVTTTDTTTTLSCDNVPILTDPVDITIPRLDDPIKFNLITQSQVNPIFADMTTDTQGTCYIISGSPDDQSAELPFAGTIFPSESNTNAEIFSSSARLLTGIAEDEAGTYLVAIEGLSIAPDDEPDVFSVTVTESLFESGDPVVAYIIARDTDLDPRLTLVSADQEPLMDSEEAVITCSHSTLPDQCWGDYADMDDATVTLGFENTVRGISSDVMLSIPLSEDMIGTALNFMVTAEAETAGDYVMLIYLSSGSFEEIEAPEGVPEDGDLDDNATDEFDPEFDEFDETTDEFDPELDEFDEFDEDTDTFDETTEDGG